MPARRAFSALNTKQIVVSSCFGRCPAPATASGCPDADTATAQNPFKNNPLQLARGLLHGMGKQRAATSINENDCQLNK